MDSLQGYHPKTLDAVKYQQKSWGVPLAYKSLVLFYHRKFVKQPPESVEEMLDCFEWRSPPQESSRSLGASTAGKLVLRTVRCLDASQHCQNMAKVPTLRGIVYCGGGPLAPIRRPSD